MFPAFVFFLVTANIILFLGTAYLKLYYASSYPYLDPARDFANPKDLIINLQPLRDYLNKMNADLGPDKMSLYLEFLNTGANISINKNLKIFPASIAKLPLAIVIMKKIENGELGLGESVILSVEDLDSQSGNLYNSLPGTSFTIDQLLYYLLVDSDNTAQHALLKKINLIDTENLITETGLEDLSDSQGMVSAKEYTRFFRLLYSSSYLEQKDSQKILGLLSKATFKDFLSQGLPANIIFAHKYGIKDTSKIYSDSGIVYIKDRPYMITVMFHNLDLETVKGLMKTISQEAYNYLSQYK